ncbi:hypothetical protein [Pseudomonas sp. GL-R-26]|uniref:hypothetical protein n=1 Tax=Pseudomonas sp. GL-R-26 TaxID=2832392 RepID=UPI001CBA745B|nr:hypothetical protein [Pseudomonas sp. GL-R-26]
MSAEDKVLIQQIAQRLRTIGANELQVLAEEMAILACPDRFKWQPLVRQGRNIDGQTNKGWPDAYVQTSPGVVDGIEATRDVQSWSKHLTADLEKAKNPLNFNLSGYFFVAGYPDHEPTGAEIKEWSEKFVNLGIPAKNIQLMIGKHLVMELSRPKYAQIRQSLLGLASSSIYFESIRESLLLKRSANLIQPTEDEFASGKVFKPNVADSVIEELQNEGLCLVRGHGACGKTTLAYWIGLSDRYFPAPVYYFDLANQNEAPIGAIKNELVELTGTGALFIIDNIHINENWAEVLLNHWREHCEISGSHLLMLGRETGAKDGTSLGSVKPKIMHAGKEEFRQLVKIRLDDKIEVPDSVLDQWLNIFGGRRGLSHGNRMVVVDLIAFGAALERRQTYIQSGNFKLAASDAVEAIRERYLQPISDPGTMANLLRLAAVSEFELRVPRAALKYPAAGLENDCVATGLVLSHHGGFALAHAALGPLLLEAAPEFDIPSERVDIAKSFPYLGLGMVRTGMQPEEHDAMKEVLKDILHSDTWVKQCSNLHDISGVVLSAIRTLKIEKSILDSVVSSHAHFRKLILKTRSLETLTSAAGSLKGVGLVNSASTILEPSDSQGLTAILGHLVSARNGEVLGFLKSLGRPKCKEFLTKININEWTSSRSVVAVDHASITCQLCRFLESIGHKDLAASPAHETIKKISPSYLFRSDLGDISNLIRLASPEDNILEPFLEHLMETGWLRTAYLETRSGQLCGALMSFANTIPSCFRYRMLLPEIVSRLEDEATKLLVSEDEYYSYCWSRGIREERLPFELAKHRSIARFVCMLGAGYALWGSSLSAVQWAWPEEATIEDVYFSRSAADSESLHLGMYELQYWLGLKFLHQIKIDLPIISDNTLIDNFVRRLEASPAPTDEGAILRLSLLEWVNHFSSPMGRAS